MMNSSIGVVILAVGQFSRLGQSRQMLFFQLKTLLERVIETLLEIIERKNVVVVLGAWCSDVDMARKDLNAPTCYNIEWESGMASSIKAGLLFFL